MIDKARELEIHDIGVRLEEETLELNRLEILSSQLNSWEESLRCVFYLRHWCTDDLSKAQRDKLINQCYESALEKATTLNDWVGIADALLSVEPGFKYRKIAYEKLLEFDIEATEDIKLLCNCNTQKFRTVGWYLQGRKAQLNL